MPDYPISTRVRIDGVDAFCTVDDLSAGRPTVRDGLSIDWGRMSLNDQPDPGGCTFTVREQVTDGNPELAGVLHAGAPVEVWCSADDGSTGADPMTWSISGLPSGDVADDWWAPTRFDPDQPMNLWGTATAGGTVVQAHPVPTPATWSGGVVFPPKPWSDNPGTWDDVQRILPGQEWQVTITARMPLGGGPGMLYCLATDNTSRTGRATVMPVDAEFFPPSTDSTYTTVTGTVRLPDYWTDPDGAWVLPGVYGLYGTGSATIAVKSVSIVPTSATVRDVLVWAGKIATVVISQNDYSAIEAAVSCTDLSAELANVTIGDDPWPVQPISDRTQRILDLVEDTTHVTYPVQIDEHLESVRVQTRDIDAQQAQDLLSSLAISAGAALWPAASASVGAYLWMEDPQSRRASRVLSVGPDGIATIVPATGADAVPQLSCRDVLRDSVQWTQDPSSVITWVDVVWLAYKGIDPETGYPVTEERTVTRVDVELAQTWGYRKASIQTELAYQGDAVALADHVLSLSRGTEWRYEGLSVDTAILTRPGTTADRLATVLDLLDGTRRIGRAIRIPDMPAWTPGGTDLGLFIEGGSYVLEDHRWKLELRASPAAGQGHSITWNEMPPGLTWDEMGSIAWDDLANVGPP